jgi:hypothetical protein
MQWQQAFSEFNLLLPYSWYIVRLLINLNATLTSRLPAGVHIIQLSCLYRFYWATFDPYRVNLVVPVGEPCSSSGEQGGDSCVELYQQMHWIFICYWRSQIIYRLSQIFKDLFNIFMPILRCFAESFLRQQYLKKFFCLYGICVSVKHGPEPGMFHSILILPDFVGPPDESDKIKYAHTVSYPQPVKNNS